MHSVFSIVLLTVHMMLAVALIGVVLLQRSEGGMGGLGGGGMSGFMTTRGSANLLPPIREALRAHATIGEICGTLREIFGSHQPR